MDSPSFSSLPPSSDLPSTITHLKSLLSFASSTLSSLPFPFPPLPSPHLLPCPYNPHHLIPPESLYHHFLKCPSVLTLPSVSPQNQESESQEIARNLDSDFVFSLEDKIRDLVSGFVYSDCPGVVSSLPEPAKSFTLPSFLLSQYANLSENGGPIGKSTKILPSEYWLLKSETESWQSFPVNYSYISLRAILGSSFISELDIKTWILDNSPKYGIIIDVTMMDHIYLLLKLCLKAVTREAYNSLVIFLRKDGALNLKCLSFECSILVNSFNWLSNQLGILYGEINARVFALGMIKEAVKKSGYCNMINNFGEKYVEIDNNNNREIGDKVFVSQIAGAIGALYQRAFLEGKIRALRSVQPVSKSHLLMEYAYLTSRAAEERSKRPNYKPILDYDSLPSNRVYNQGNNGREKTKEEILAEERDYKRRRISYRGKKMKRSPTEVLRDIIQQHMEELGLTNNEQPSSNPNKSQNQNPNSSNTYESIYQKNPNSSNTCESIYRTNPNSSNTYESIYRKNPYSPNTYKSEHERSEYSSHYSSRSNKEYKDRNYGNKDRDRDEIDRHRSKEKREDNNDRYKRKEIRRDRRSESVTFDDRYDPYT